MHENSLSEYKKNIKNDFLWFGVKKQFWEIFEKKNVDFAQKKQKTGYAEISMAVFFVIFGFLGIFVPPLPYFLPFFCKNRAKRFFVLLAVLRMVPIHVSTIFRHIKTCSLCFWKKKNFDILFSTAFLNYVYEVPYITCLNH